MTISDSLPIQFWIPSSPTSTDPLTFNEKEPYGIIKKDCFFQPITVGDSIRIQYTSGTRGNLYVHESDGSSPNHLEFTEIIPYTYELTATLWDYFPLATWTDTGTDPLVSISASQITYSVTAFSRVKWALPMKISSGKTISFNLSFLPISTGPITINVSLGDGTTSVTNSYNPNLSSGVSQTFAFSLTAPVDSDRIEIIIVSGSGTQDGIITMPTTLIWPTAPVYLAIRREGDDTKLLAKSDPLDIKISHQDTIQIEYYNTSNFDGIQYLESSPPPAFYLRIPAVFNEERNPQEQEDVELSNGEIVTIRQSIQQKKLLETGYMPNYMHLKLQKVLMHDTVIIDGETWRKRDSYDDSPVRKYNLKTAKVLLTKYDSVEKNTI